MTQALGPDTAGATRRLAGDAAGIAAAAALLQGGGTVAFPTETVYGLGADARNGRAVAAIFAAKDRPAFNPLIVHVASLASARALVEMGDPAERLVQAFWPGPLTLVLPLRSDAGLSSLVTAGLPSLALRMPAAEIALDLLSAAGGPVAAPSANPSGLISPTRAEHVLHRLDGRIGAVLDGGPCPVGVESTILDLTGPPRLLRAGGLTVEALQDALGGPVATATQGPVRAPGMLASHYAPRMSLRLDAARAGPGERYLGFGPGPAGSATLSAEGDLAEAAARLFDVLHRLDAEGPEPVAVAPIPDRGLGRAINDRLRRAAAPRPPRPPRPPRA